MRTRLSYLELVLAVLLTCHTVTHVQTPHVQVRFRASAASVETVLSMQIFTFASYFAFKTSQFTAVLKNMLSDVGQKRESGSFE